MTTIYAKIADQVAAMGRHVNPEAGDRMSLTFVPNYLPLIGDVIVNGVVEFEFFERKDGSVLVAKPM